MRRMAEGARQNGPMARILVTEKIAEPGLDRLRDGLASATDEAFIATFKAREVGAALTLLTRLTLKTRKAI